MSQDQGALHAQNTGLVDPNVPADQGLSTLGLLMQLAGSVLAGFGALLMFYFMLLPLGMGGEKGMVILIAATCVTRSVFHRMAGSDLLYRRQTLDGQVSPLAGVKRYILVALGQTVLVALILKFKFHTPGKAVFAIACGFALWPALLAVLFQLPRFKRFQTELPVPEDKGFEGASVLMTVLGTCAVIGTGAFLFITVKELDALLSQGPGILMFGALVMLFIRSIFHVQAGLSGLRETSVDRSVELANRYANFGVIASFCAAGAMLLFSMMGRPNMGVIAMISGICWLLLAWPMIIRRFFSDRQFVDLMAGDGANLHRRAPDAGLTGLGWLLVGMAIYRGSFLLPTLIMSGGDGMGGVGEMFYLLSPQGFRSIWWEVGVVALQGWAGFELIRMSPHSRIIGSVFAIVAVAITLYVQWPMFKALSRFSGNPQAVLGFIPLAIALVLPVVTLLLVNRKITPTATARYKPSGAPQG